MSGCVRIGPLLACLVSDGRSNWSVPQFPRPRKVAAAVVVGIVVVLRCTGVPLHPPRTPHSWLHHLYPGNSNGRNIDKGDLDSGSCLIEYSSRPLSHFVLVIKETVSQNHTELRSLTSKTIYVYRYI